MDESNLEAAVVVVYYKETSKQLNRGATLRSPRLVTLGGRVFLTGIAWRPEQWWSSGKRLHVALDEVQSFYSFETEESHEEAFKLFPRRRGLIRRWFR